MIGIVHRFHEWFRKQLDGSRDSTRNCTMAAGSMMLHRHTLGRIKISPQRLRDLTYDHVGGNTLDQLKTALTRAGFSGFSGPYRGIPHRTFYAYLRGGHGAVVQGSSKATAATRWRASWTFVGNHAWYVSSGKGWRQISGVWKPDYLRIRDPLADGRRAGIAQSPFWVPRSVFERFCALLSFGGYTLGYGRAYALFSKKTSPHVHPTVAGITYARAHFKLRSGHTIRRRPRGVIIRKTKDTDVFDVWGYVTIDGRRWYTDHSGTRWIPAAARKAA